MRRSRAQPVTIEQDNSNPSGLMVLGSCILCFLALLQQRSNILERYMQGACI